MALKFTVKAPSLLLKPKTIIAKRKKISSENIATLKHHMHLGDAEIQS
jgi:hypothetical protein